MNLRLTTFTKTLPQMSFESLLNRYILKFTCFCVTFKSFIVLRCIKFHLYFFLLFLFRSGAPPMTLQTAGALTADPKLPATAINVCTTTRYTCLDLDLLAVDYLLPPSSLLCRGSRGIAVTLGMSAHPIIRGSA